MHKKNQIRFLNVNGNDCLDPNDETRPVGVELYLVNSDGDYDSYINEEFKNLFDHYLFDYKSNVCKRNIVNIPKTKKGKCYRFVFKMFWLQVIDIKFMKRTIERVNSRNDDGDSPRVTTAIYLLGVAGISAVLVLILVSVLL